MGVNPGAALLLTADLTRISWLLRHAGARKAPYALLDAFLERLGPEGTLVIPTFNHDLRSGDRYDPRRSPTITGSLGQAALRHPAFARTGNALHSFAVAGRLQPEFLAVEATSSFGERSAFALLRMYRFRLLALDMHADQAFSYFHHVEELEAVPYRHWRTLDLEYVGPDGGSSRRSFRLYAKRPGYANEITALLPLLSASGAMSTGRAAGLDLLSIDLEGAHGVIANDIRSNKARSIVRFTLRTWLRDIWHTLVPARSMSRSAQLLRDLDAGAL